MRPKKRTIKKGVGVKIDGRTERKYSESRERERERERDRQRRKEDEKNEYKHR